MTSTNETRFYKEPTHEEIALTAFLAWEKDGRPNGADFRYWLEAEAKLRAQRQKQAETAANLAAKPWPPGARAKAKPVATRTSTQATTSRTIGRASVVKASRPSQPAVLRPTRATSLRAAR